MAYLDHFATTPLDPQVLEAMLPYFCEDFGNPATDTHSWGQRARDAVERARHTVARVVGCDGASGVIYTSGATESNNLAILGVAEKHGDGRRRIIVSAVEHKSVLEPARWLSERGFVVTILPVSRTGTVDPSTLASKLTSDTLLVSIMAVNNELGTIQPIDEIASLLQGRGILFHCDATQAVGKLPIDMQAQGIHLLSLSAHKLYGPKGVGALCVAGEQGPDSLLEPRALGGGQEHRLRSGTLNVPGIVGLGKALTLMESHAPDEPHRVRSLRDRLRQGLERTIDGISINGDPALAIPGALNLSIDGVRSSALLARVRDIALTGAAACGGQSNKSHVLSAIGLDRARIQSALRFCVGRFNTEEDIDVAVGRIASEVTWIRQQPRFDLSSAS